MMKEKETAMEDSASPSAGKYASGGNNPLSAKSPLSQHKPSAAERIGIGRPR
jgi:hypothetical protein